MPSEEFAPRIDPGEALGAAPLPYGALLPPLLNPALRSEGAEVAAEGDDEAFGAVPSVPADGAVLDPDALEPDPLLVPPLISNSPKAAGPKTAHPKVKDNPSAKAVNDLFILKTC